MLCSRHKVHALRELQAVTDNAPGGAWCWAAQAAEALTGTQALVSEVIARGRDTVDPAALAALIYRYRSAGAARGMPDRGPLWHADEKAPRPGPPPA
jgi:transposase